MTWGEAESGGHAFHPSTWQPVCQLGVACALSRSTDRLKPCVSITVLKNSYGVHLPAPPPPRLPLWQVVHTDWDDFLARYERHHRAAMGPLRPESVAAVQAYYRCGDLTTGFARYHCPDCGHERLLAFTCKARHICPACHHRRTRQTAEWISTHVCHPVPHRQFVFTIPKVLRGLPVAHRLARLA